MAQGGVDPFEAGTLKLPEASRLLAVIAPHPTRVGGTGKAPRQIAGLRVTEKFIEHRVRIGRGRQVLGSPRVPERFQRFTIELPRGEALRVRDDDAHFRITETSRASCD